MLEFRLEERWGNSAEVRDISCGYNRDTEPSVTLRVNNSKRFKHKKIKMNTQYAMESLSVHKS